MNVSTVTLAEIYFQQGLKEQALQIYREPKEREPENQEINRRIEEIEAWEPDEDSNKDKEKKPRPGVRIKRKKR